MGTVSPALVAALADRYRIERELGAGGMATVYLAEDLKHHRLVALKVLRDDLTASLGKERFLREISIAAGLTHPHILPLHDSGEANGHLFYVMPYVDGQTLRQRLIKAGELPIPDAVRALRDIADAMSHAHKRGVVHRDLKPENVMLSDRHAVVMDFGVAKALSEATGRQQLTTMGVALGTPSYMSPEQATADPNTDARSDIYSFGVVAYELLTGRTPFVGGSPQEVLAAHVTAAVPPITNHRTSIPPALAMFVMKCLEKKPADRWQSADEMIPQLEALLTPSGGITPHSTAPYAAASATPVRARSGQSWIAITAVAALVVAVAVFAYGKRASGRATTISTRQDSIWVAVLPPQNLGRPEDEAFADGLADEIRGALARSGVQVKGSRSSQVFRGSSESIPEIARKLGVAYVVTGTVRWIPTTAGSGRVIMAAEVVDGTTETVRGRASFDTTIADLYAGQVAIAQRAGHELGRILGAGTSTASPTTGMAETRTVKPEAYATFLAGREALNRYTQQSLRRSVELFRQAVALDSNYAKAHAFRALAVMLTTPRSTATMISPDDVLEWETAIQHAVSLAPDDADVLMAQGWAQRYSWKWQQARENFLRAVSVQPDNGWALWGLTQAEAALGNYDAAIEAGRRAATVDPVTSGDIYPLALWFAGRFDDVLAAARAGLAVDSLSTANCWWCHVGQALAWRGDVSGYRAAEARAIALGRDSLRLETVALAKAGRMADARAAAEQRDRAARDGSGSQMPAAIGWVAVGEHDRAIRWLEDIVAKKLVVTGLVTNPYLAPLRTNPRYIALLKRVGLR